MSKTEAQKKAVKKWEQEKCFRTLVRFPKPLEPVIRDAAEQAKESLNKFIIKAVLMRIQKGE